MSGLMSTECSREDSFVKHKIEKDGITPLVDNLKDLKEFVYIRLKAIKDTKNQAASVETIRNYWNNFTGA